MRATRWMALPLLFAAAGCQFMAEDDMPNSGDGGEDAGGDTDSDTDTGTETGADTDVDAGIDGGDTESLFDATAGYEIDGGSPFIRSHGYGGMMAIDRGSVDSALLPFVHVSFFDVGEDYVPAVENEEVLVPSTGLDSCELAFLDGGETGGWGSTAWLAADSVVLSACGYSQALEWFDGWYGNFMGGECTGEDWALTVSGGDAPSFVMDPAIHVPPWVDPNLYDLTLPRAALPLGWTPGPPGGGIWIQIGLDDPIFDPSGTDSYRVTCHVEDDGDFEIPTEVMEPLPAGWLGELTISRRARVDHPIPGDLLFAVSAYVFDTQHVAMGE